ncbi:hypothetical protein G3O08_15905 [Cryomorpha ignava]|uniref:Fibronectin type-III domain-containing protein n=1 Tax=Cryomorpha ignava TaxID=101383 RepID=A0A7K3WWJ5_9FLAO|nr:fibronectin type III domain-containing protein [Cryomorpha ignava]NEN24985.1 hypothetical protein [Cryomorpha ignava]
MSKIKIGLRDLNCEEKVEMAKRIESGLKSVTEFKKHKALIRDLIKSRNSLIQAIEMAAFGDKRAIGARNLCEKQLDSIIRKAAAYVNHESNGCDELIVSAGFELRKRNNTPSELESPEGLKIKRTEKSGELKLNWKPVKNSRNYLVQFTAKKPAKKTDWETLFSTRSGCFLNALIPGKIYRIRILAVGAKGVSEPGEMIEIMAA